MTTPPDPPLGGGSLSAPEPASEASSTEDLSCLPQVSSDPSMYIEVENEVTAGGGLKLSRLKCSREGKEWETVLPGRILTAAGSG